MTNLTELSRQMRTDMLKMAYSVGKTGAHIGPSLSLTEIMAVLYFSVMNFDPKNPQHDSRDRLILSKGHGVMAQYAAMKQLGMITDEELLTFKQNGSKLSAHPSLNRELGIEFSSGSLGQGLSLGVGCALALKRKKLSSRVFVILGDGECNEGSIWEAAMYASYQKLNNLTVIIDKNNIQYDDFTDNILSMNPLDKKWESFGFETKTVNGHDTEQLTQALSLKAEKPVAVIAETIKGKGVSFMENNPQWHNGILSQELYEKALVEIGGANA